MKLRVGPTRCAQRSRPSKTNGRVGPRGRFRTATIAVLLGGMFLSFLARSDSNAQQKAPSPAEPPYGIEKRVPWTTSRMMGSPEPPAPYLMKRVFPQLRL